jgi:hypothetical protein
VPIQPLQRLHRGLSRPSPVKLGGHDLAVFGQPLLPDHHQITVGALDPVWKFQDADWRDYEPEDDLREAYEHWREYNQEPEDMHEQ